MTGFGKTAGKANCIETLNGGGETLEKKGCLAWVTGDCGGASADFPNEQLALLAYLLMP